MTRKLGQNSFEHDAAALKTILGGPQFLQTPLTSAAWDGDSFSDVLADTAIDLSAVFGAPAGIRAILMKVEVRDSGSAGSDCYIIFRPAGAVSNWTVAQRAGEVNDRPAGQTAWIPCDANGDIEYQIRASGANTFDVWVEIWGYCI
jgi:hypothetical protein